MARLEYNGISIEEPLQTILWERVPVFNGPDFLYVKHILHVRGVFNPFSTSSLAGVAMPAVTDKAIRQALLVPRKTFLYKPDIVNESIRSPVQGFTVDCHNGPTPIACNVTAMQGQRTWMVEWAGETCINECPGEGGNPPSVLLSHRCRMMGDVDQDHFSTRTIRGRAIFRSDRLSQLNAVADDFRAFLFHPVPVGFRRDHINVVATEDGTELEYELVDRQKALSLVVEGVTRIEATHTQGITSPGAEEGGWQVGMSVWDGARSIVSDGMSNGIGPNFAFNAANSGLGVISTIRNNVPRRINRIVVRVWGSPVSSRSYLQRVAAKITLQKITAIQRATGTMNAFVTHDLMGKFVETSIDLVGSPSQTFLPAMFGGLPAFEFPESDDLEGIAMAGAIDVSGPTNHNGSRGSYLARMAALALRDACEVPPKLAGPDQAKILTPP